MFISNETHINFFLILNIYNFSVKLRERAKQSTPERVEGRGQREELCEERDERCHLRAQQSHPHRRLSHGWHHQSFAGLKQKHFFLKNMIFYHEIKTKPPCRNMSRRIMIFSRLRDEN